MAKPVKPPPQTPPDPLVSPAGHIWLAGELAVAEDELKHGPGGQGWLHNESKRPALTERAAFLASLIKLLP